jgi:hypothetical protein
LRQQRQRKVVVRVREVRPDVDGPAVTGDRRVELPQVAERIAKIVVRLLVI